MDMRPTFNLVQYVFADGVITDGTADRLAEFLRKKNVQPGALVYLNSPGGSLGEGMKLGQVIRQARLNSNIGRLDSLLTLKPGERLPQNCAHETDPEQYSICMYKDVKIAPGDCMSACTLAYLGGDYRYMSEGSRFGVHRFYSTVNSATALDDAQIISGEILQYLSAMGIDPRLFSLMTKAGPNDILFLDRTELASLHVYTDATKSESWDFNSVPGATYLVGKKEDERGISKFIVGCIRNEKQLVALGIVPLPDAQSASAVADQATSVGYFSDDDINTLSTDEHNAKLQARGYEVSVSFGLGTSDLARLVVSKSIGIAILQKNLPGLFSGFRISMENGREKLKNYAEECWQHAIDDPSPNPLARSTDDGKLVSDHDIIDENLPYKQKWAALFRLLKSHAIKEINVSATEISSLEDLPASAVSDVVGTNLERHHIWGSLEQDGQTHQIGMFVHNRTNTNVSKIVVRERDKDCDDVSGQTVYFLIDLEQAALKPNEAGYFLMKRTYPESFNIKPGQETWCSDIVKGF
jgi:hypothetical protein